MLWITRRAWYSVEFLQWCGLERRLLRCRLSYLVVTCKCSYISIWRKYANVLDQLFCAKCLHHRIHPLPTRCGSSSFGTPLTNDSTHTGLPRTRRLVSSSRYQHSEWIRRNQEQSRTCHLPSICVLPGPGLSVLHQLRKKATLGDGSDPHEKSTGMSI